MKIRKYYNNAISFVFVILLIFMIIGVSYAMLRFSKTGSKENVITTGQINVSFEEQNNILIKNRYPETDAVGLANTDANSQMTFTVSSDIVGDISLNYAVGLTEIKQGETLTDDYIKIYLEKNGNVAPGFYENEGYLVSEFRTQKVEGYINRYVIAQGSVTGTQTDTYTLKAWIDENYDLPTNNTENNNVHSNQTVSETFSFKIKVVVLQEINLDSSGASAPELASNMIPVYYDKTNDVWRKADSLNVSSEHQWYDYNSKMWANAVTVSEENDSTGDLVNAEVGTPIPMERINTIWVWIPRFSVVGDTANYNGGTIEAPGAFDITFVGIDEEAHDAFYCEIQLSGFWIGKFENSIEEECEPADNSYDGENCNIIPEKVFILPNKISWRGRKDRAGVWVDINQEDHIDKNNNNTRPHVNQISSNNWGAVAYLSQSIYGRCSSSTNCKAPGINNNSNYITGYGAPAGAGIDKNNGPYNTTQGMNASTTGNIYGVYDMSGGANDFVAGYDISLWPFNKDTTQITNTDVYYLSDEDYITLKLQHGLIETAGWYSGTHDFVNETTPYLVRGGCYSDSNANLFSYYSNDGNAKINVTSRYMIQFGRAGK